MWTGTKGRGLGEVLRKEETIIFYVGVMSKDEVALGREIYLVSTFAGAISEENKNVCELAKEGMKFEKLDVIVLSTMASDNYPIELSAKLGKHYKYVFLNETAREIAVRNGIECNLIGGIEEKELPPDIILLIRAKWFKPIFK